MLLLLEYLYGAGPPKPREGGMRVETGVGLAPFDESRPGFVFPREFNRPLVSPF